MNFKYSLLIVLALSVQLISAQQVITPEKAVSLTLENNFGIKITNKSVELAKNNANILNSGYLPTLTGNAGSTFNKDNTKAEFSDGRIRNLKGAKSSRYNAGLNINYTLFDGFGRAYNYKKLKEQYNLSELEARAKIENTVIELFSVYYNVAQLSENLNTLNQTISISKDRLKRSEYQFEYGQSSKLAVLNARVDINNDSINIINTKQLLNNTKRDLNVVFGNVLDNNFNVDTNPELIKLLNKTDLFEKAKTRNVALLQTDKSILINNLTLKNSKSNFLPKIGLNGTYGWNKNNNNAASFVSVVTSTGLSGGVNLSWNLFDGGKTVTQIKNARINIETQELQKEQLLINITRNFNNLWDNYENKLNIYNIQERNKATTQSNFERTKEQFKIGQVNSIEFRQAQLNLLNAQLSLTQAKYAAKISELQLLQLSGELLNSKF